MGVTRSIEKHQSGTEAACDIGRPLSWQARNQILRLISKDVRPLIFKQLCGNYQGLQAADLMRETGIALVTSATSACGQAREACRRHQALASVRRPPLSQATGPSSSEGERPKGFLETGRVTIGPVTPNICISHADTAVYHLTG